MKIGELLVMASRDIPWGENVGLHPRPDGLSETKNQPADIEADTSGQDMVAVCCSWRGYGSHRIPRPPLIDA